MAHGERWVEIFNVFSRQWGLFLCIFQPSLTGHALWAPDATLTRGTSFAGVTSLLLPSKVMEFCGRVLYAPRCLTKLHPCSMLPAAFTPGLLHPCAHDEVGWTSAFRLRAPVRHGLARVIKGVSTA